MTKLATNLTLSYFAFNYSKKTLTQNCHLFHHCCRVRLQSAVSLCYFVSTNVYWGDQPRGLVVRVSDC